MPRIKILSGHSAEGGSTTIFINLTNLFNEHGWDATFYGPQNFHLDKCQAAPIEDCYFEEDDIVIMHYLTMQQRPPVKKCIYACHEKWWFEMSKIKQYWDVAVFNHEEQRNYHRAYQGPFVYIPNPKEPLYAIDKPELDLVAGVIGSIEDRKQTHVSIERALADGCTKVKLFGRKNEISPYYHQHMLDYINDPRIEFMGYTNDKQGMYNQIGRVYHSSKGEVSCLVKDECQYTNTKFFGNEQTTHLVSELSNAEILQLWEQLWK